MSLTPVSIAGPQFAPIASTHSPALATCGTLRVRLAQTEEDRRAIYRLRFTVFNLELHEGLESAYREGLDADDFDAVCDHLLVEHTSSGRVVGTYRMQAGEVAGRHLGYYSEQEFHFQPYEAMRSQMIELGRACVHRDFRDSQVLHLLWKGVVRYARERGARYLIGCCSLSSQEPAEGHALYERLRAYEIEPALTTVPTAACALPAVEVDPGYAEPPRLLSAYLALGARICGPPAIDYAFGTIDFLTLIDLEMLHPRVLRRFL